MANTKKMQEEAIASVNTAKAMVDKVLTLMQIIVVDPYAALSFSTSTDFIAQLLKDLGVSREELELWLTNFLVYTMPALEISVKTILLTNLKNMISCSVDPRIPEKYRKQHKKITDYNTSQEYGIDINIESIDFMDKLSINPLGDFGSNWYFGLENIEDAYKFARADDMDAFLWFVIHKGKFPNSSVIDKLSDIGGERATVTPTEGNGSLLSTVDVVYDKSDSSSILLGNTFNYDNGHVISMCIDRKLGDKGNIIHNTLVPVSDDWSSVNWYARRSDQFGKNLGFGWGVDQKKGTTKYKGEGRDFSKEKAICNIQYISQASSDAPLTGLVNNKFRFTILPKPLVHIPNLAKGEPPWRFKKMLFNDKGEYDPNGKYTLIERDNNSLEYLGGDVTIDPKSGSVTVSSENKNNVIKNLIECYPGLTVYEFNYDYVMSMKLFDAKVIAHSLMESVLNTHIGISGGLSVNLRHQEGTETIKQIIKNILESDDTQISDCYYTFDNTKYDALLRKAEEKRARQERFGDTTHESGLFDTVNDILKEYDANTELHEQVEVLHRAITQAAVTISEGVQEQDKPNVEINFIFDLIESLTTTIINGILSPKVLMLLEVNQKIMGGTWEKFTLKDLIEALRSIIIAIVNEIRDLILQELMKLLLRVLDPLIQTISSAIVREQIESYADAILDIMRNCPPIWLKFGNEYENTTLDIVDYADIDVNETKQGEQPLIKNC